MTEDERIEKAAAEIAEVLKRYSVDFVYEFDTEADAPKAVFIGLECTEYEDGWISDVLDHNTQH